MKYEEEFNNFYNSLKATNFTRHSIKEVAIYLLFREYCAFSEERCSRYLDLRTDESYLFEEQSVLFKLSEKLKELNLNDSDIREWANKITELSVNNYSIDITHDFMLLICRLLDLKQSDILYESYACDEKFLYEANKYVNLQSDSILKLRTIFSTFNDIKADNTEMLFVLNDINYHKISSKNNSYKVMNPNKIFINPLYLGVRNPGFKNESNNQWEELLNIAKNLQSGQRVIAAIPDNLLSRNFDSMYRKKLLETKHVEGLISIPSKLFSNNSNLLVTLVILGDSSDNVKYFDGRIFDNNDIKSAGLSNIANLIFDRYNDEDCTHIDYRDLIVRGSILSISNILGFKVSEEYSLSPKLSEIASISKGYKGTASSFNDCLTDSSDSNYYVLTSKDIENGVINYENMIKIIDGRKYEKYFLLNGDLVLTNKSTKVKIAVASNLDNKKVIVSGSMIIIRPNFDKINPVYLKMFFESSKGRSVLASIQKGTVISTMTLEDLCDLRVSCPEMQKQIEFVNLYRNLQEQFEIKKKELDTLQEKINNVFDLINMEE